MPDAVKLDMSTSVPLTQPVKLDMSTSVPLGGPSDDWLKAHYANYGDTSIEQARQRYNNRGVLDKIGDFMQDHNIVDSMTQHAINAIDAGKQGQYARAANESVKSVAPIALAHIPGQLAVRPLATLAGIGTGAVGGAVTQGIAKSAGASPDQAELAGTVGGILSGAAGMNAPKALPLLGKAAGKLSDAIDPDLLGLFSPRAAAGLRWLSKAGKLANTLGGDSGGLAEVAQPHIDKVTQLSNQLADALSKANAIPPEGPTATFKDVPDLRVQPQQQAPMNLLDMRKAAFMAAQRGAQGEFPVSPLEAAPAQSPAPTKATPNAAIYDEAIPEKTAQQIYAEKFLQKSVPKPTLLEQLKQWDQIRQIHSQLEDQIGKGQDEIQQWMEEHNQHAPGGKKPVPAPIVAEAPRVPQSDADLESLLMKSVQAAKAKKAMAAKAGD